MDPENIVLSKVEEEIPKLEEEIPKVEDIPKVEKVRLVDVPVVNQDVALNLMVSFLNTAQSRGVFNIEESAKIWECVRFFIIPK